MSMLLPRDTLLHPYFVITLEGAELPDNLRKAITSVSVTESDSEANLGVISVEDAMHQWVNLASLKKKAKMTITLGHLKKSRMMIDGEVKFIEADFGEDGIPNLSIGVVDLTSKMHSEQKERAWDNKTGLQVVQAVAKEYGFQVINSGNSPVRDKITQEKETDAQLIHRLADDDGFIVYLKVAEKTIYYGDRFSDLTPKDTIFYDSGDSTVRTFKPTFVEKNTPDDIESKTSDISDETGSNTPSEQSGSSIGGSQAPTSSQAGGSNTGISVKTGAVMER